MKLLAIELRNFLSHGETSWEPNGARLASIVGPNGAGKSSLLDGVLYSLFDAARARTDQLVRLGETDMSAAVTFEFAGATYRVVRGRTTKAGGRSYLELHVGDGEGSWKPLTGDDIRTTQAAIEDLLGLDAATFTSAAFLRQGEADAFVSATPGDRKRILGQVLGLDVYAAAETRARDLARDVEARIAADRAQAERLEDEVAAGREGLEAELGQAREALQGTTELLAEKAEERTDIDDYIRERTAELAAAQAIADQVASLEREKAAQAEAWRAARGRLEGSTAEISRLEGLFADSDAVAAAVGDLPAARAEVDRLVAIEAEDRKLTRDIADLERAIRDLQIPHEQRAAAWRADHERAQARVAELRDHVAAGTATCVTCGQPVEAKQAKAQLQAAREELVALGDAPREPLSISRTRAAKFRLEIRAREIAWEPKALVDARARLTELERQAARAETLAAAATSTKREREAIAAAQAELDRIAARGRELADEIAALAPRLAGRAEAETALASARKQRETVVAELEQLESSRRQLERAIAAGEAHLANLEARAAEASRIRDRLAGDETEAGRLRRLVQAFGVSGIPARIVAGVVPELERYANELLAELRPGMSLSVETQRARKSGEGVIDALDLVVRDPAGERALGLYSGGERMSVSLSLAVGLSRLVARRAGARIGTLVIDEPDGLDADARRAFGMALRVIAHRGDLERVVLVSHHPDLAEYGDAIYQVTKGPAGSTVELVAT